MMLKINDYKINIIKLICSIALRTNVWYNISKWRLKWKKYICV